MPGRPVTKASRACLRQNWWLGFLVVCSDVTSPPQGQTAAAKEQESKRGEEEKPKLYISGWWNNSRALLSAG